MGTDLWRPTTREESCNQDIADVPPVLSGDDIILEETSARPLLRESSHQKRMTDKQLGFLRMAESTRTAMVYYWDSMPYIAMQVMQQMTLPLIHPRLIF